MRIIRHENHGMASGMSRAKITERIICGSKYKYKYSYNYKYSNSYKYKHTVKWGPSSGMSFMVLEGMRRPEITRKIILTNKKHNLIGI